MIPVDIDNFIVTKITNFCYDTKYIYIKNVSFLPKEISNCTKLTNCCIVNNRILDISMLSKCLSITGY